MAIFEFDPNKEYRTRDGGKFRFLNWYNNSHYPIRGEYTSPAGRTRVCLWTKDGGYDRWRRQTPFDLIEGASSSKILDRLRTFNPCSDENWLETIKDAISEIERLNSLINPTYGEQE